MQLRDTVSGVLLARMDIPIQTWHMVDTMRSDFNEHHMMQVPMTENQLGGMQMMEEVAEHVGNNYIETPNSRNLGLNRSPICSFRGKRDL